MDTIFQRVGMMLAADLEALLTAAEDPEAAAAQMVREIGEAARRARAAAAKLDVDIQRLERMREHNAEEADEWSGRALLALQRGREDLASEAVDRELQMRRAAEGLQPQLDALNARRLQVGTEREGLEAKLKEAQRRARQLLHRRPAEQSRARFHAVHQHLAEEAHHHHFAGLDNHHARWPTAAEPWEALAEEGEAPAGEPSPDLHARLADLRKAAEKSAAGGEG